MYVCVHVMTAGFMQGHEHIAAELLQHGADLDYIDDTGFTALLWAVEASELGCVKLLIEAGALTDDLEATVLSSDQH